MKIECNPGCGQWHDMTPTALMVAISAFQEGELQRVQGHGGIVPLCLLMALTEERVRAMQFRYPGRTIKVETYVSYGEDDSGSTSESALAGGPA